MEPYELGVFRVGDSIPPLAIQKDGCIISCVGGALHINTLVYRPRPSMLADADIDRNGMRLGIYIYRDVMMMALKLGNLPWQDAPFTPHLESAEDLPKNELLPKGEGLLSYHLLIDSSEGRILQIKPFVLSSHFSNSLINAIHTLMEAPFDYGEYLATLCDIQRRYSPRELGMQLRQDYFHLPPGGK